MAVEQRLLTLDEFLAAPEEEPALEFDADGTVSQKMSPKGQHSTLQGALCELINTFARQQHIAVAFPELRAVYAGAAYVPDIAVYRWDRIPRTSDGKVANDFRAPPDIAVEIVSPEQSPNALIRRSLWYVRHGVQIALLVDPGDDSVIRWHAQDPTAVLRRADVISFGNVLPGLQLTVDELFQMLYLP
ncbi:MAG: Uma2 family endonuclease [Chloroflexota bacterium]